MFTIYGPIGLAHLLERRFDEALIWLRRALHEQLGGPHLLAGLVCTYSYLGCMKDARAMLQRLVEVGPQTLIEWQRWFEVYRHARDRTLLLEGLRLAGMPEG